MHIFDINSSKMFCLMYNFISETLSLNLCHCYLKCRIPDIAKPLRNMKGHLISQKFWKMWWDCKIKIHMFTGLEHEKKKKDKKCLNEMKCYIYTVLDLVLLVKMKNIILKKIYLTQGLQLRPATGDFRWPLNHKWTENHRT